MARTPSPVRPTGLGPVKNTSLLGGLIPAKLTPVRATGGPRAPQASRMPSFGPSNKQTFRPIPTVRSRTGGQRRVSLPPKLRAAKR